MGRSSAQAFPQDVQLAEAGHRCCSRDDHMAKTSVCTEKLEIGPTDRSAELGARHGYADARLVRLKINIKFRETRAPADAGGKKKQGFVCAYEGGKKTKQEFFDRHNSNALLRQVKGVDGIKTGYTEASGYNLVSSVRRDEKHIVAVVLGGTSNAARDARMRQLIEDHISQASIQRTLPIVREANGQPSADGQWALYLASQVLRDRIARLNGNDFNVFAHVRRVIFFFFFFFFNARRETLAAMLRHAA